MKACVFTLGCKQNEAESASLMRGLTELGYEVTDELGYADLYLLNTCAVTAEAEKKSRQAVARMRKFNPSAPVIVCGCASEHNAAAFAEREGVLFVTGAMHKDKVLEMVASHAPSLGRGVGGRGNTPPQSPAVTAPPEGGASLPPPKEGGRGVGNETSFCELPFPVRTKTRAYLRVQDGCNRFCSYCLIPYLRGRSRSRKKESVLGEAMQCSAREIVLTGIDLSDYRDGDTDLGGLFLLLKDVPARIRLGSLEVGAVTEEFLKKMEAAGNVVPHFHLSLQSGSTAVLRAMNRKYTREEYLAACERIYARFPNAAITTDIIVGFPAETEEDFEDSLSIIDAARFSRVHAFPFSPREGTVAYKMKDISPTVKKERMERMLRAAEEAETRYMLRFLGKEGTALFESDGGYTENYLRVYNEAAREGGLYRVRLVRREKDGIYAEILEEL